MASCKKETTVGYEQMAECHMPTSSNKYVETILSKVHAHQHIQLM